MSGRAAVPGRQSTNENMLRAKLRNGGASCAQFLCRTWKVRPPREAGDRARAVNRKRKHAAGETAHWLFASLASFGRAGSPALPPIALRADLRRACPSASPRTRRSVPLEKRRRATDADRSRDVGGNKLAAELVLVHTKLIRARTAALGAREQETLVRLCAKLIAEDSARFAIEMVQVESPRLKARSGKTGVRTPA